MKNSEYLNSALPNYKLRKPKYFIFDDSCVKAPHTAA